LNENWNPDKFITYRYISDFAVVTFNVPGMSDWTEEMWDMAAEDDLKSYVTEPEAYYVDDCWENELALEQYEEYGTAQV
jgi:hypothetical protein